MKSLLSTFKFDIHRPQRKHTNIEKAKLINPKRSKKGKKSLKNRMYIKTPNRVKGKRSVGRDGGTGMGYITPEYISPQFISTSQRVCGK